MKKLLLLFTIITFQLVQAQQTNPPVVPATSAPKGTGKITGIVLDSASRQPVSYATIALINQSTNKPTDGAVADDKGQFSLNKIPAGNYKISVTFIGYKSYEKANITIAEKGSDINVGIISLPEETKQLQEVTVVGQKDLIEEKVDRTVYNAEQDKTTTGGDATDVLKRVPMLSVDMDGNVSMRGSSNIKVLINNKPSTITAGSVADALKQIPADQIKSVEVITSPSAKYDAEGSGGIINIILKKNNMKGLTLNIDGSAGARGSNLGLNGSYRKGKLGVSLGGFGRANYNVKGEFDNSQTTRNIDSLGTLLSESVTGQTASTRQAGIFGRYNLGFDYDIDKNNSITASVQYGLRNQNSYQDRLFSNTITTDSKGTTQSSNYRDVNTKDLSGTVDVSLNYQHLFKKPQQEFSILTLYSRNNRTNDFYNNYLTATDFSTYSRLKNENESYNQEITVQLDYQTPIGKTQMVEFGGKEIMRQVSSAYKYFSTDSTGNFVELNTASTPSNKFNYNQNITAGYLSYTLTTAKKVSLKVGGRYEYTTIAANFQNTTETVNIDPYGILVPSVNLSKRLKSGSTIKLSYNYRIQRPSIQFLNPNVQQSNPLSKSVGNPELDPEKTNNFELGYSTFIKSIVLNVSAFARMTGNAIQAVRSSENAVISTTYQNIGQENAYGLNTFIGINSGKLSLNGGGDIYFADLKNNNSDFRYNASNQGWVYSLRAFGGYSFSNGWGLQLFSFYRGRQVQLQGYQGGFGTYSLSVRKEFNQKKASLGFGAENFFSTHMKINTKLESPLVSQRSTNTMYNMNFKVTFSYRIGKMTFDTGKRKKSVNNDDLKEGDGGGQDNNQGGNNGGGNNGGGRRRQ
jgi:outer membrane receptor protein involved in Fe transport